MSPPDAWRVRRAAMYRRWHRERWAERRLAEQENAPWWQKLARSFNNAFTDPEWVAEREALEEKDAWNASRQRFAPRTNRPAYDGPGPTSTFWQRYPGLAEKLAATGLFGFFGSGYMLTMAGAEKLSDATKEWGKPNSGISTGGATETNKPQLPQPDHSLPDDMVDGKNGGGGAAAPNPKRKRDDEDDSMRDSQNSAAGGSISVNMTQGGARPRTSGYGGLGVAAAIGNSIMSTPGRRNHNMLAALDEFKKRGSKRAKSGISRLFEAAEEWVPFHLQVVQTVEGIPRTTMPSPYASMTGMWRGSLIARSRVTYGAIMHMSSAAVPAQAASTWDLQYLRNGLFASAPATTTVGGVTPGMRTSIAPHIGKLIVNGSFQVAFYDLGDDSDLKIGQSEVQLHLVRFSNQETHALTQEATDAQACDTMVSWLDVSDFDLGVGCESYVNGNMITEQAAIAPAGTNAILLQEEHLYPPRRKYKVHWSSPIFTLNRCVEGNQASNAIAAGAAAPNSFNHPRVDLTNIEIPIDHTVVFDEGATPELNSEATNRGDPFTNYQFVITAKPRLVDTALFERNVGQFLVKYDTILRCAATGQFTYVYNFRDTQ